MIRLYFNRRDDLAGCWSVDHGPGTPEIKTNEVRFWNLIGVTKTDLTKHGPNEISAWIEFGDADATRMNDMIVLNKRIV